MSIEMTCNKLRNRDRMRNDYHSAEKALTCQMKAICRRHIGGNKDDANALFKKIEANPSLSDEPIAPILQVFMMARDVLERARKYEEEQIEKLARELPIWAWIRDEVRGCSALTLGLIVGEACGAELSTIDQYDGPAKLWKRFGLAIVEGERQGRRSDPDLAALHGYSPSRRSRLWVAGDCLIKAGEKGKYYQIYRARKDYLTERGWCGKCHAKNEKTDREVCTPAHLHNSAKRYMEKAFLKDLWREWRKDATAEARTEAA
jgi:hypothetical protein